MALYKLGDVSPTLAASAYVAPTASVIGNAVLAGNSSVWFGATLRGDNETISIGGRQQRAGWRRTAHGSRISAAGGRQRVDRTSGNAARLHGRRRFADRNSGGVLNAAVIGKGCLVGAGAVVTERKTFADGTLILGAPARAVRELSAGEREDLLKIAANYASRSAFYRSRLLRIA